MKRKGVLLVLLAVFLLLVGMYVYHVNSLKEGAWAVGGYTSRRGIQISRDSIDKALDYQAAAVPPDGVNPRLFYRDRLNELSTWTERLSMPEIKAEIQTLLNRPLNLPVGPKDITDIVSQMKNKLLLRDAGGVGVSPTIEQFQEYFPSGPNVRTGFENIANQLDQVFKQLKLEGFSFDEVWNYFMDNYPLLDSGGWRGGLKETNLKAKWEQEWKEYPEPPEWGVTGTTTTTTGGGGVVVDPLKDPLKGPPGGGEIHLPEVP